MALPFKKNNPGCPCCGQPECPCACYAFEDNAEDSSISNLHLTSTGASLSDYTTGHLDRAFKHTGSQYHEHADNACFNLSGGINVWFWIKADYETPYSYGVVSDYEGIVTKATWGDTGAGPDYDGEWGVFWSPPSGASPYTGFIYFTVGNGKSDSVFAVDSVGAYTHEKRWEFFFFWVSISEGKLYLIRDGGSTSEANLTGTQTLTSDKKLFIGNNDGFAKLGEQTYDSVPRPWLIDNVGFCKDIGTQAEMEERAENLYNNGYGRACNHAGFEGGGCCA